MSYLDDKIVAAQGLLGRQKTAVETDAVRHDSFDAAMFRELIDEAPALADLAYVDLGKRYDYTEDLIRDVLMEFWQSDPVLRSPKEMHPSFLLNHGVADDMAKAPETPQTRAFTKHDRYGSAMATIAVTNQIKESLERAKEAQEAAAEAAKAEQELQERLKELMEAMGGCGFPTSPADDGAPVPGDGEQGMPGPNGVPDPAGMPSGPWGDQEGPVTLEQAVAYETLLAALEAAEIADLTYEQTLADAQDQAELVQNAIRHPIREAISEVGNTLADEAELFASWGVEDGLLKRLSFQQRQALASALRRNRMAEFRKLLGRFKIMQAAQSAQHVEFARDEAYDVELSGRLPDVLAGEWARVINKHTRLEFLEDLAEDRLLSKKYRGIEKVGQGSIICLVDNSGSMTARAGAAVGGVVPSREAYAKAFALALLDQARGAGRDFVGINFSSSHQVSVFRFPKGKGDIHEVIRFVEEFWNGGTDFMAPLDKAIEILDAEYNSDGLVKADLVLITDDDCRVTPAWFANYQAKKAELGFRTFGIAVGRGAGNALAQLSDNVRSIMEFSDPMAVADIIRTI